jgi:uncharacterized protein (TIGR03083 family)
VHVESLTEPEWEMPSVIPRWRVADLVAHCGLVADSVLAAAREQAPPSTPPQALTDYVGGYLLGADEIDARTRELSQSEGVAALSALDRLHRAVEDAFLLPTLAFDPVVQARRGPIRWSDFMSTRCIELAVHSDDLSRSLPDRSPVVQTKRCLGIAVRALADVLAQRSPGRSVEVRIPPYAAVQSVAGPRHTRGTPGAVVELEPLTFLRVATGRLSWSEALRDGSVRASGQRTDLSGQFPLLS